jgi:hypothetical protein
MEHEALDAHVHTLSTITQQQTGRRQAAHLFVRQAALQRVPLGHEVAASTASARERQAKM